jgi:hypothetical protein
VKHCKRCGESWDLSNFRVDVKGRDGHYSICNTCIADSSDLRVSKRPDVESKVCTACQQAKPGTAFGVDRRQPDGLRRKCKECRHAAGYGNYATMSEEKREKCRQRSLEWQRKNPNLLKASRAKSDRKRSYGMSEDEYRKRLAAQDNKCYLCGKPETQMSNGKDIDDLSVDHDHTTGKIRKLLCSKCNLGLGLFKDNVEIMRRAAEYLRRNKSS